MTCRECAAGTEHCHDILVIHIDGSAECVNTDCSDGADSHEWVYACIDVEWDCDCARTGHRQPLAA